jgi:Zn-dependent protease
MSGFDIEGLVLWFVAFLLSTTFHEAAHAWVAKLGGDRTAHEVGQVSLNPIPHVRREPLGMVVVPLFVYAASGFMIGWASAPYDPHWAARHPKRAGVMAAAGPGINLLLAVLFALVIKLLIAGGWGVAPDTATFEGLIAPVEAGATALAVAKLLSILVVLNALLGVFNLMPLPPLDGASVLEAFGGSTAERAMGWLRSAPMAGLIGLLVAWQLFGAIAGPLFGAILFVLHPGLYA